MKYVDWDTAKAAWERVQQRKKIEENYKALQKEIPFEKLLERIRRMSEAGYSSLHTDYYTFRQCMDFMSKLLTKGFKLGEIEETKVFRLFKRNESYYSFTISWGEEENGTT